MIGGIHGTRLLAAAFADVHLRRIGRLKPPLQYANRNHWRDGEEDDAIMMRRRGFTDAQIGAALKRTPEAVTSKLGYVARYRIGAAA